MELSVAQRSCSLLGTVGAVGACGCGRACAHTSLATELKLQKATLASDRKMKLLIFLLRRLIAVHPDWKVMAAVWL